MYVYMYVLYDGSEVVLHVLSKKSTQSYVAAIVPTAAKRTNCN